MRKIPTLFLRDASNPSRVTPEVNPEAAWLLEGTGSVATVKKDGANVRVVVEHKQDHTSVKLEKRRNPSREAKRIAEVAGVPQPEPTYVQALRSDPGDKHLFAAFDSTEGRGDWPEGSWPCEALGPKIQGGAEGMEPTLYNFTLYPEVPEHPPEPTFDSIRAYLSAYEIEGIVWHGEGGRMCKIKRKDFGLPWPVK